MSLTKVSIFTELNCLAQSLALAVYPELTVCINESTINCFICISLFFPAMLIELLRKKPKSVYMIFCNTTKASYWLSQTLQEASIENVLLNKDVDEKVLYIYSHPLKNLFWLH